MPRKPEKNAKRHLLDLHGPHHDKFFFFFPLFRSVFKPSMVALQPPPIPRLTQHLAYAPQFYVSFLP